MQDLTPELFAEAVAKGASFLERDGMDFGKWSLLMVHQFGEQIRPDLEGIWTCAHNERQRRQTATASLPPDGQPPPTSGQVRSVWRRELPRPLLIPLYAVIVVMLVASVWFGWRERTTREAATVAVDSAMKEAASAPSVPAIDFEPEPRNDFENLQARAEKGDAEAQSGLGWCYCYGLGVPQNYTAAASWFRKAAEQGDAEAQCGLGWCYSKGRGVPQDDAEAVKWFRKAADQGHASAQYNLGLCYFGQGVPQDYTEAVRWFRAAAAQGQADAQYNIGVAYLQGQGVPKGDTEGVKWFRKAADQGHASAQYNLGDCYLQGQGVRQDDREAAKWFRRAADQGDAGGQFNLGVCYSKGRGVPQNDREGDKWLRKAAEQGLAIAQYAVGLSYYMGKGVPQNETEAYMWLSLAAAQRNEDAAHWRDLVTQRMTRAEVVEGQRRAADFVARKESDDFSGSFGAKTLPRVVGFGALASGTGFFISDDGYFLSNSHVVEGASRVRIKTSAGLLAAKVVKSDPINDIALLKVSGSSRALPIARNREGKMGESIFTVGFPNISLQGIEPKLTKGELSSLAGAQDDPRHFQISAAVQPGNSGGPLMDAFGNVIGIVTARLSDAAALETSGALPQNVNYAIKISYALPLLEAVPGLTGKLKVSHPAKERKFEDVVQEARDATVLVLVY